MSLNSCLNSCILLYLLALSPVEINLLAIFDNSLVTTSTKSKVDCHCRKFAGLSIIITRYSHSDTYCNRSLL